MYKKKLIIPLSVPNLGEQEWQQVKECLDANWISSAGGFIEKFENALCEYVKSKYAVACINGTSSLFMAFKVLGIKMNDEVIVPTLTFIAPVNAVRYVGAEPVFMDCDDYMNLDAEKLADFCKKECRMSKAGLKNKKTGRIVKAVVPVHVFGNPCNMVDIMKVAKIYNLLVIEDAAESVGSHYTSGDCKNRFTGTVGDVGVYSFNGNKIVTAGSGGIVVSNDRKMIEKIRYLVNQAKDDPLRHLHNNVGYNFRLTNMQAALGIAQLKKIEHFISVKKKNYQLYEEKLQGISGIRLLETPPGTRPNYWLHSLIIDKHRYGLSPMALMKRLMKKNIQTRPVWYLNHLQKPYKNNQAYKIEKALYFLESVLNLPSSSSLKLDEINKVVDEIKI